MWVSLLIPLVGIFIHGSHCHSRHKRDVKEMPFNQTLEKLNWKFWYEHAADTLEMRLNHLKNAGFPGIDKKKPARNVILFLGDGMGASTVTAIRKLKGDMKQEDFWTHKLAWDDFPFAGHSKTYELDNFVADSAGTATAYLSGVKTRMGFIGLDATGDRTCSSGTKGHIESIAHWAKNAGKVAGFVTTTSITHASPSPLYAHQPAPLRDFEYYTNEKTFGGYNFTHFPNCTDLSSQFVKQAHHIKVALGGGYSYFTPNNMSIPFVKDGESTGLRTDGRNLIDEWKNDRLKRATNVEFVHDLDGLKKVDNKRVDYLLGLFSHSAMEYIDDKPNDTQPTLTDLANKALDILDLNPNGYFLLIEGGRIDHGHHDGIARYALTEGVEFDRAISAVLERVNLKETLIVITADHSHTFSVGGYLPHESSIFGFSQEFGTDGKPFTSLIYANGPGAELVAQDGSLGHEGSRRNDTLEQAGASKYLQQSIVPLSSETHGGEDVPVYANGIYSELFTGVFEQNYIAWAMACAAGLKPKEMSDRLAEICPSAIGADFVPRKSSGTNAQLASIAMILFNLLFFASF